MKEANALMSLGCLWEKEVIDADASIARADDLMYQEKRAYYATKK